MQLKALKDKLTDNLTTENKVFLTILVVSLILSFFTQLIKPPYEENLIPQKLRKNLDVFLPKDHVLFPVEIENFEAIDSLIEAQAFTKVFSPTSGKLLAENIKLLRAPKDPNQFSFVLPVKIAKTLALEGSIFRLVIQKETKQPAQVTSKQILHRKPKTTYGNKI